MDFPRENDLLLYFRVPENKSCVEANLYLSTNTNRLNFYRQMEGYIHHIWHKKIKRIKLQCQIEPGDEKILTEKNSNNVKSDETNCYTLLRVSVIAQCISILFCPSLVVFFCSFFGERGDRARVAIAGFISRACS